MQWSLIYILVCFWWVGTPSNTFSAPLVLWLCWSFFLQKYFSKVLDKVLLVWSWKNIQLLRVTTSLNFIIIKSLKNLLKFGELLSNLSWMLFFSFLPVLSVTCSFGPRICNHISYVSRIMQSKLILTSLVEHNV